MNSHILNNIKILIVEDNALIALELKDTLQRLDYIVTGTLKKESDVLKSVEENEPHIILIDINLNQKKNGIEIVNEIYKTKTIPVIFLSGIDNEDLLNEAIKDKQASYLAKPFHQVQLKKAIELIISEYY